jgi:integrase
VSVNIELRALRAALNTARRWKLVAVNPFEEVVFADVPDIEPVFFTIQQFQLFLALIKEDWFRDVVLFAVLTGLRKGEILNLQWSDVDLVQQLVHIHTSANFKTKQGRRRRIPLNEAATALLRLKQGKSTSQFVFTLNGKQIYKGWVQRLFKRYVRQAGLPEKLHFHSTRHSFASWLVQGGATLYEVQKLLGHSSPKVTAVYSHLQPEHLHDTVNRIELSMN